MVLYYTVDSYIEVFDQIIMPENDNDQGPKFTIDIEGTLHPWDKDTITTEEIIELGGWEPSKGAILIDKDNNETTLQAGQVVELKPGMGFSKKVRFKRGSHV